MFSFYWLGLKKIFDVGKKIFLVILVYLVVISLFLHFIKKDKPTVSVDLTEKNRQEIYKVINDPQLNKTQEGKMVIGVYRAMLCVTIGEACTNNPSDAEKNFNHSLFGFLTKLIALPYTNPPASGIYWAYSGLQNAGFIPKTYAAQGIGFGSIKALNKVWLVLRDFSFMVLVLVIIAIGFMIMFRAKLNPQTVISVENALPKIVITMILINFSFAIAGFLIDLMYLSIAIIVSLLANAGGLNTTEMINYYLTAGWLNVFGNLFPGINFGSKLGNVFIVFPINLFRIFGWWGLVLYSLTSVIIGLVFITPLFDKAIDIAENAAPEIAGQPGGMGILWRILASIAGALGFLTTKGIGISLGFLAVPILIWVVILLTIVYITFRIIFILINAYIKILLLIIFSPLIILLNAIPGEAPFNFNTWFKNILAEILTFPIVVAIFMTGAVITKTLASSENPLWGPPFLFGINPEIFVFFVGMGILFLTPDLVSLFKQLLIPKPMPFPSMGPGIFFSGATSLGGGALEEAGKWGSTMYHFHYLKPILKKIGIPIKD